MNDHDKDNSGESSPQPKPRQYRCVHCGYICSQEEMLPGPILRCPRCNMPVNERLDVA